MIKFQNTDRLKGEDPEFIELVEQDLNELAEKAENLRMTLQLAATDGDMAQPDEVQIAANNLEVIREMLTGATFERIEAGFGLGDQ